MIAVVCKEICSLGFLSRVGKTQGMESLPAGVS